MAETNEQEMWLKMMSKLEELGEKFDKNKVDNDKKFQEMHEEFQDMGEKFDKNKVDNDKKFQEMRVDNDKKFQETREKFQEMHEQFQDIKVEFQKARGKLQEESETVSEKPSEIDVPTNHKISNAKRRRIRKLRILKSLGIKVSKFRKRLEKATRLDRVK
jgi:hypothetical protein